MTEHDLLQATTLRNILAVFVKHNYVCNVSLDGETLVFDAPDQDLPFKQELINAGATYDLARQCWTYWDDTE